MDQNKIDRFQKIAGGGKKKLDAEIKRLAEIDPPRIDRKEYPECKATAVEIPVFTEEEEYAAFRKELADLRLKYEPFLIDRGEEITAPIVKKELKEFKYRKETDVDKECFINVLNGYGEWQDITLPKYEGPEGVWNAFYRTEIEIGEKAIGKRYLVEFEAVDYIAEVYLNGRMIARHEGFFAPFEADLTDYLICGKNVLLIVVKNDITTSGIEIDGFTHYGKKIYAETHLGYDEPYLGWHHCPAGAGIFGKVYFCVTEEQRISDIFVQPDIDGGKITIKTTVRDYSFSHEKYKIKYSVEGRNFESTPIFIESETNFTTNGENYITQEVAIENFRLWTQDEPYLYNLTVTLVSNEKTIDCKKTHFGMRKFRMDESSEPKGAFYLNNKRIILRGTNEMGHLPRAVMDGDDQRLIDDILIAKVANLNFYRMTQRPVFDKIYTYFDMLGMLCQTDFPLFSYIGYSATGEALKQVDEMEKLTRNHPSVIIESFCNETLDRTAWGTEQYVLSRREIERFFDAAANVVKIDNPDRVLKYCEGDYAPIEDTHGISDFHCYTFWYVSHGMPRGKLNKGYLPPIRKGWFTGCGEYGVDGLDRFGLMKKYCPKEWLPETDTEPWSPKKIAREQCYVLHGDFFPEQDNAKDWITRSRRWQKEAIKQYVHILRRRTDMIESTAVHLLIDAWPTGWTKTLVDVDRIPKPAFYAFKEANIPARISLRRDKYTVYAGDNVVTEVYALNDIAEEIKTHTEVAVYFNGELYKSYASDEVAKPCVQTYLGEIKTVIPTDFVGKISVRAKSIINGEETYDEVEYIVKSPLKKSRITPKIFGERVKDFSKICGGEISDDVWVCDGDFFVSHKDEVEEKVRNGAKAIIFTNRSLSVIGDDVIFPIHTLEEEVRANNFVARSDRSAYTKEFGEEDFKNFYNEDKDYQDLTAWFKFEWSGAEEILYTYVDCNDKKYDLQKKHLLIAGEKKYGKGSVVLSTLSALNGCIGCNPVLDKFLINLININGECNEET